MMREIAREGRVRRRGRGGWSVAVRGNSEMEKWRYSLKSLRGTGRESERLVRSSKLLKQKPADGIYQYINRKISVHQKPEQNPSPGNDPNQIDFRRPNLFLRAAKCSAMKSRSSHIQSSPTNTAHAATKVAIGLVLYWSHGIGGHARFVKGRWRRRRSGGEGVRGC